MQYCTHCGGKSVGQHPSKHPEDLSSPGVGNKLGGSILGPFVAVLLFELLLQHIA